MKSAADLLREQQMLEVAQELRRVFGAKLVAIRSADGTLHGRAELLDEFGGEGPNNHEQVKETWRGKGFTR